MAPPTAPLNLDVEAISGICGSISIACWVVVFSPQIVENFRRSSADGLSLQFIIVWLLGDVFNIIGAVLQGVLPTMTILAIYYTIADVVLLGQCFYYRGFTWRDEVAPPPKRTRAERQAEPNEETSLLSDSTMTTTLTPAAPSDPTSSHGRQESDWSNLSHLSPAVPLLADVQERSAPHHPSPPPPPPPTRLQAAAFNSLAVLMVCGAGVVGWYLSQRGTSDNEDGSHSGSGEDGQLAFNVWGQVFGWLCAVFYLGSRLPQLLLNWRRKSTEGVSMLFFLFACLGNLTYVLSIFAFEPRCDDPGRCRPGELRTIYGRYILVNLSWLVGSAGTLFLDLAIFVQFFIYSKGDDDDDDYDSDAVDENFWGSDEEEGRVPEGRLEESESEDEWDPRPVLQRDGSDFRRR